MHLKRARGWKMNAYSELAPDAIIVIVRDYIDRHIPNISGAALHAVLSAVAVEIAAARGDFIATVVVIGVWSVFRGRERRVFFAKKN